MFKNAASWIETRDWDVHSLMSEWIGQRIENNQHVPWNVEKQNLTKIVFGLLSISRITFVEHSKISNPGVTATDCLKS